ncbi:hypothetical protein HUO13_11320 [Saccharopolyspora erythraea]|uniref:hypothetical protein n=1 Tax=Saccharopolyspora erythraea TaxID=1836 RepID=UPI001BA6EFF5|nr:hypothetical protein [Saccharopolyspora erythraea]QUH01314.1 hypothetical protein HUO13_11320 [Saccharopolyspora erythraea]
MTADAWNVALNIIASAITGSVVWLTARLVARRRLGRKREFFGLVADSDYLVVVPRHASSTQDHSVHRNDAAALLELSATVGDCGARPNVIFHDQAYAGIADKAEFCIGGPTANRRTVAHMRSALPGLALLDSDRSQPITIAVGEHHYEFEQGRVEYVALAKIVRARLDKPTFLICGQSSTSNRAAGRYLASHYRDLMRAHGTHGRFCVVLRVLESEVYGPNVVELVGDVTDAVFTRNVLVTGATGS